MTSSNCRDCIHCRTSPAYDEVPEQLRCRLGVTACHTTDGAYADECTYLQVPRTNTPFLSAVR